MGSSDTGGEAAAALAVALIVDDSRLIRKTVSRVITDINASVVIVEGQNGREGLTRLAEIRTQYAADPAFIISDLEMPEMDGWEFIKALRQDYEDRGLHRGVPVIVLSSSSGEKGWLFSKQSVHDDGLGYVPLVTVAKDACIRPDQYQAAGEKGLARWVRYFLTLPRNPS